MLSVDLRTQERYHQLSHALHIASSFETQLLRHWGLAEQHHHPSMEDLIENDDWMQHLEVHVSFNRTEEYVNMADRHTQGSEAKQKHKRLGLNHIRNVRVHASTLPNDVLARTGHHSGHRELGGCSLFQRIGFCLARRSLRARSAGAGFGGAI